MKLSRLQELSTLIEAEAAPTKRSASKDFAGIQNVVQDCLDDLKDKLGKGGSLATLFKSSGASALDTVKDDQGKNVLKQIIDTTTDFKKSIEKLMTEAEILLSQVDEGLESDGDLLAESSSEYDDSSEFTEEFYGILAKLAKLETEIEKRLKSKKYDFTDLLEAIITIQQKMVNPRWMNWMRSTDDNFSTDTRQLAKEALADIKAMISAIRDPSKSAESASNAHQALEDLTKNLSEISDEFDRADGISDHDDDDSDSEHVDADDVQPVNDEDDESK